MAAWRGGFRTVVEIYADAATHNDGLRARRWHKMPEAHLGAFLSEFQKSGSMIRASSAPRFER